MLTINNLTDAVVLDREAAGELAGGYFANYMALINNTTNVFTQNATNVTIGAGNAGLVSVGSLSLTPVSAGSAMTWLQTV